MLVTLGLSTTTTVWVIAGVHNHTTDFGSFTEPAASAGLTDLALGMLLAKLSVPVK